MIGASKVMDSNNKRNRGGPGGLILEMIAIGLGTLAGLGSTAVVAGSHGVVLLSQKEAMELQQTLELGKRDLAELKARLKNLK